MTDAVPSRLPRTWRAWTDPVLGAAGLIFGLGSLTYPFGRDQGLYYYVAREWVIRGAVPYRDVLDHKTPGIYLLYGLAIRLFGERMWGIRVLDLVGVAATGIVAAELSATRGERVAPGVRGAAWLAASVLYYGYLDFWSTAQSELWYGLLAVASVAAAYRFRDDVRAAVIAGLLSGAALTMKPPAMWLVLVAAACLAWRTWGAGATLLARARPAIRALLLFCVGSALVPALVCGYFASKGALPAMIDIVVGANRYYVEHEQGTRGELYLYPWYFFPLGPAILAYLATTLVRARRACGAGAFERHVLCALVTAAAYAAVFMQGKYYLLHWTVAVPALAAIVANAFRTLAEICERRGCRWSVPLLYVVSLASLYGLAMARLPVMDMRGPAMWWTSTRHAGRWWRGRLTRDELTTYYQTPGGQFWFEHSEHVGDWLREHTTPDETVTVRGFQPEIYAVAGRHHAGRFFWTTFLTHPARAYRREEWLREDLEALSKTPPKYVVTLTHVPTGPDSVSYFEPLGYRTVEVMGEFTIMSRGPAPSR